MGWRLHPNQKQLIILYIEFNQIHKHSYIYDWWNFNL